jgi:hypothetical protein
MSYAAVVHKQCPTRRLQKPAPIIKIFKGRLPSAKQFGVFPCHLQTLQRCGCLLLYGCGTFSAAIKYGRDIIKKLH